MNVSCARPAWCGVDGVEFFLCILVFFSLYFPYISTSARGLGGDRVLRGGGLGRLKRMVLSAT